MITLCTGVLGVFHKVCYRAPLSKICDNVVRQSINVGLNPLEALSGRSLVN